MSINSIFHKLYLLSIYYIIYLFYSLFSGSQSEASEEKLGPVLRTLWCAIRT